MEYYIISQLIEDPIIEDASYSCNLGLMTDKDAAVAEFVRLTEENPDKMIGIAPIKVVDNLNDVILQ